MPVESGNKVKVEYEGTFEDGEIFDSSEKHGKPLEFTAGGKQVVPGFDNAVIGMEKGDEKDVTLQPDEAYGQPNPQLVQKIPKDKMPGEVKVGMILGMNLPNGHQVPARVTEIGENEVTIDINHPLAGRVLKFHIKLIDYE